MTKPGRRSSGRPPWHRAVVLAGALPLALAGCAIPDDAAPRALEPGGVPFRLLATSTTSTSAPAEGRVPEVSVPVFLVDNDTGRLVEVARPVSVPSSVRAPLEELLDGPTEEELARGLRSNVARSTRLLNVDGPTGGVLTVDLNDLSGIAGQGQRLALAQVVFTATAHPEVNEVLFRFGGQPSEVPDDQGVSTAEPLGRADFATFDPNAPVTITVPGPPPPSPSD